MTGIWKLAPSQPADPGERSGREEVYSASSKSVLYTRSDGYPDLAATPDTMRDEP